MARIAIDAGHGRYTAGKRCLKKLDKKETREWVLNDRVADALGSYLKKAGHTVKRMDDTDGSTDVSLEKRVKKANDWDADFFISVHHNSGIGGGSGGGTEVYISPSCQSKSKKAQNAIYKHAIKRGNLKGNRADGTKTASFYVIKHTKMPACLIECGFMDSKKDIKKILDKNWSKKIALGIAEGICEVFGGKIKDGKKLGYWYFRYPFKVMGISQNYNGSYSHRKYSTGNKKDYPVDEAGANTGRDWMYAMNDLVVKKIYGLGSKSQPNTIWFQTRRKVITPLGIGYVTFRCTHMSDADLRKFRVGQVVKRGTKLFREGTDGGATGNHIHMTFGQGKYKSPGWRENNKGAFVLTTTGKNRKPEKLLFRDKAFTKKIRSTAGLKFPVKPKRKTMVTKKKVKVRKSYSVKSKRVGTMAKGKKVTVYVTRGKWSCIGPNMWIYSKYLK